MHYMFQTCNRNSNLLIGIEPQNMYVLSTDCRIALLVALSNTKSKLKEKQSSVKALNVMEELIAYQGNNVRFILLKVQNDVSMIEDF